MRHKGVEEIEDENEEKLCKIVPLLAYPRSESEKCSLNAGRATRIYL